MSRNQKDFISKVRNNLNYQKFQLMDKNPETRLVSKNVFTDIINHPYFNGIDFEKLKRREYKSPYIPKENVLTLH